ncbi:unnamed protein product [Auanema sp. JU1783]|nr:unnamed protein product [Auanema sp. JU1783]
MVHQELRSRWYDLTAFMPADKRDNWWNIVASAYEQRPFRGLEHLANMLQLFDKCKDSLKDRYATGFAIFFKNIAYDPLSEDSAEKSAKLLRDFAQETTFDSANYVAEMIVASGSSTTDAHLNAGQTGSDDLHYLIDFDMAFLADPEDKFQKNELAQRKEYAHLTGEEYAKQRLKVLKLFLQIPNIFATAELRQEFEERARKNISREIELLENGNRKYD